MDAQQLRESRLKAAESEVERLIRQHGAVANDNGWDCDDERGRYTKVVEFRTDDPEGDVVAFRVSFVHGSAVVSEVSEDGLS